MHRLHPGRRHVARKLAICLGTLLLLLPAVAAFAAPAQAQDAGDTDEVVIFVLDLSGSMNEPFNDDQTKLDVAKAAFTEAFANVSPDALVGLRTYGDQIAPTVPGDREASCTSDTRIASPVAPLQRDRLIEQVQGFTALGDTPMGLAIRAASADIPAGSTGTIVLFSDGRDECFDADLDGDPASGPSFGEEPCQVARSITAGDSPVDRVVTVGFRADTAAETELRCIAESTGGTYTAIETPADARDALPQLLVQLSAPREAQRLIGRQIQGAITIEDAPDFVRLDEAGADKVLYTDSIDMNSVRIYRMPVFGPDGGTFTATVFGLPPELGIAFDMRIFVPSLDQRFFQGEHGDFDAGLPERPTASIRCTDCQITGGPHEAFFVVTLDAEGAAIEGTYELEILTEGPGFGGSTTSCAAPQECFYPQAIVDLTGQVEATRSSITDDVGELAPDELIAERDQLRIDSAAAQEVIEAANARAAELEERIPLAPRASNSFRLPLLMMLAGAGLAMAPVQKLRANKSDRDESDGDDRDDDDRDDAASTDKDERSSKRRGRKKKNATDTDSVPSPIPGEPAAAPGRPTLDDVGPAPAIRPNQNPNANNWDQELEAAKAAIAQQRPDRPAGAAPDPVAMPQPAALPAEPLAPNTNPTPQSLVSPAPPEQTAPISQPTALPAPQPMAKPANSGGFSEEQHAAAKAAAEKIIAERSEQAATAGAPIALEATTPSPPDQAAATQVAAERAAAENASREVAEQKALQDAEHAAAQQAAAEQKALQDAEHAAAQQAAAEAAQRAEAERAAAEKAAREAAERAEAERAAAAKQAAAEAAQRAEAERTAAEKAAREAAEREAAERAAAAKQAAAEAAQRAEAERAAAERAAAEKAVIEKATADRVAAEAAARAAAEKAAADKAAADKAAADRAQAELAAKQAAERLVAERAAAVQAANQRAAADRAAAEAAAQRAVAEEAAARAQKRAAEQAAAQAATTPPTSPTPATPSSPDAAAMTEEERRQEARQRMLAKQNIVASSSSSGASSGPGTDSSAGSAALVRPPTNVPSTPGAPAQRRTPEAPGWYEDPAIVDQFRWWDGSTWTGHTAATSQEQAPS